VHVRHEEVAAFAAGAEAHLSEELAVCAGTHIHDTHVPGEEPSTASRADITPVVREGLVDLRSLFGIWQYSKDSQRPAYCLHTVSC
jgi:hypothetical protein